MTSKYEKFFPFGGREKQSQSVKKTCRTGSKPIHG
jgi:hypothetical protein